MFKFRAFKVAVKKLLDTLEEPPEPPPDTEKEREKYAREAAENFGTAPRSPSFFWRLKSRLKPRGLGYSVFGRGLRNSHLLYPEDARRMMGRHPVWVRAMEREHHDFRMARAALELKPEKEDDFAAVKRIMKDRNLDPENDQAPPDLQDAVNSSTTSGRPS